MPESKGRGRPKARVPADPVKDAQPLTSPRWLVPVMLTCFILGLLWIVLYYLVRDLPCHLRAG